MENFLKFENKKIIVVKNNIKTSDRKLMLLKTRMIKRYGDFVKNGANTMQYDIIYM